VAKDVLIGVQIQDTQLQDLLKRIGNLTASIKTIDASFIHLSQTIQNTNQNMQQITATLQAAAAQTNRMNQNVTNITRHIYRWGALISGMAMLLGGGGLFGMRRLADDLIARRRRDLAGGGGYAERAYFETQGKSILDDPSGFLAKIRTGQTHMGGPEYLAMKRLGLSDTDLDPSKTKDVEVMEKLLPLMAKKAAEVMRENPRQFGDIWDNLFGPILKSDEARRLATPEGKAAAEGIAERSKLWRERVKPEDLEAWTKFWEQIKTFTTTLQVDATVLLAPLAVSLTEVSKGFSNLADILTKLAGMTDLISGLSMALSDFGKMLQSESVGELIQRYITLVSDVVKFFINKEWQAIQWLFNKLMGTGGGGGAVDQFGNPIYTDQNVQAGPHAGEGGGGGGGGAAPAPVPPGEPHGRRGSLPPGSTPPASAPSQTGAVPGPAPLTRFIPGPRAPLTPMTKTTPTAAGSTFSNWQSITGPAAPFQMPGSGGGSSNRSVLFNNQNSWKAGAQMMAPPAVTGGGGVTGSAGGGVLPGQERLGALDLGNWQSTKTASLVVRQVPSANLHLAATAMAGMGV
jgi:hypothetical protein